VRLYERVGIRGFQAIQKMRERRQPLTKEEMGIRENVIGSLSGEDIIEEIKCVDILQKKYFRYKLTERGSNFFFSFSFRIPILIPCLFVF